MGICMKTTLEIPDPLYREIKAHAAARGQTVKVFVNEAVEEKLGREKPKAGAQRGWRSVFGRASTKSVQQAQEAIDSEFSRIDPEDWQ